MTSEGGKILLRYYFGTTCYEVIILNHNFTDAGILISSQHKYESALLAEYIYIYIYIYIYRVVDKSVIGHPVIA